MRILICTDCGLKRSVDKFNLDSASPSVCFRCRVSTIRLGFAQGKEHWHGDSLHGGTIASDNRHTIAEAKSNGYNPVPVKNGESSWAPTASNINKLKTALGGS